MENDELKPIGVRWWIKCDQTQEHQDFARFEDCVGWSIAVRNTFATWGNGDLTFTVRKIREWECKL